MSWFKVDDGFEGHPKVERCSLAAVGLWTLAGSRSSRHLTDGFVPEYWVRKQPSGRKLAGELVRARLWTAGENAEGEPGYWFWQWDERNPASEAEKARKRADAARQKLARDPGLRTAIRERDGDLCRFCGVRCEFTVDSRPGSGPNGGTFDHLVPDGHTDEANLVTACRSCNSRKRRRTPRQAGMRLLRPGTTAEDVQRLSERTPAGRPSGQASDVGGESESPMDGTGQGRDGQAGHESTQEGQT